MKKRIIFATLVAVALVSYWYFIKKSETAPQTVVAPITATFACDNSKVIQASFINGETVPIVAGTRPIPNGIVELDFGNAKRMTLGQTISADGARYANHDESFVFWNKGNGAMVLQNGVEKDYTGCLVVAPKPVNSGLDEVYSNAVKGFSVRTPRGYVHDGTYQYQMTPEEAIDGVKFTIPPTLAVGTNLAQDTYLSIEHLPGADNCTADLFLYDNVSAKDVTENGVAYSMASSTGAGAGNRYEETVYAVQGSNPCTAVRYFVHYGVIENYTPGAVREFNEKVLLAQFDAIRRTLVIN
jgi:membrane-bound inhibitor of C-type lysozyme